MKKGLCVLLLVAVCLLSMPTLSLSAAVDPLVISSCDQNTGWFDSAGEAVVDTALKAEGSGSVTTSATGMALLKCTFEARDMTDIQALEFSLYLQDASLLNNADVWTACIDLGLGGILTRWWLGVEGKHDFVNGWQTVRLPLSSGSADSGFDIANVNEFRLYVYPNSNGFKINIDHLKLLPYNTEAITISDCETGTGWFDTSGAAAVDTSQKSDGGASVTTSNTSMAQLKCIFDTRDFTNINTIEFSLYLQNADLLNNAGDWSACIDLGNSVSDKLIRWWLGSMGKNDFVNGWQTVTLPLSSGATDDGFDITRVDQFRIYVYPNTAGYKMNVDGLGVYGSFPAPDTLVSLGGSIRLTGNAEGTYALRFGADLTDMGNDGMFNGKVISSYGFLLIAKENLPDGDLMEFGATYNKMKDVPALLLYNDTTSEGNRYIRYTAVIKGMPASGLSRDFAARPYIKFDDDTYVYGQQVIRSYNQVLALMDK